MSPSAYATVCIKSEVTLCVVLKRIQLEYNTSRLRRTKSQLNVVEFDGFLARNCSVRVSFRRYFLGVLGFHSRCFHSAPTTVTPTVDQMHDINNYVCLSQLSLSPPSTTLWFWLGLSVRWLIGVWTVRLSDELLSQCIIMLSTF